MSNKLQENESYCWESFFRCCFKKSSINESFVNNGSKYEYIVEKLVIKRVPLILLKSQKDMYKIEEASENFENTGSTLPESFNSLSNLST